MSAPVARASRSMKAAPSRPAATAQLHSRNSPSSASARPMEARSSDWRASVAEVQAPDAKLRRPGAPCAMM
jgi:hypothetical protein